jgi:predicted nucleic acid-binding protein
MSSVLPDSNVWISWLVNDPGSNRFSAVFADDSSVVVPTVIVYEVTRWLLVNNRAAVARRARERMERMQLVPLDGNLASRAAKIACEHRLAMADAMILATALEFDAEVWTQDVDFADVPGVRRFERL